MAQDLAVLVGSTPHHHRCWATTGGQDGATNAAVQHLHAAYDELAAALNRAEAPGHHHVNRHYSQEEPVGQTTDGGCTRTLSSHGIRPPRKDVLADREAPSRRSGACKPAQQFTASDTRVDAIGFGFEGRYPEEVVHFAYWCKKLVEASRNPSKRRGA